MADIQTTETKPKKVPKKKGPIRWEALIPVTIIGVLGYAYFTWYFDHHLKKLIEYVGTQANGAEVNVAGIRTSFLKASFDLDGLEVTDKEMPTQNLVSINNIHFQYMWDALLRMKFVVDDASINQIQVNSKRQSPGRVLPPSPAKPSKMESMQQEVLAQLKTEYSNNMLGDVVSLLEGADPKDQLEKIRGELKSEKRLNAMIADVQEKQQHWQAEVTRLSDTSKIKEIEKEVAAVKSEKNFLKQLKSVKALTDLLGDVQKQVKEIQSAEKKLESEIKLVASYPKEVQGLVNEDLASLKSRFQVPQLDVKDMAMALFAKEFSGYLVKARKYQALAKQYLPEKKEREEVVPPPRAVGKTFEFPITVSYPLFWLKHAGISSKGNANSYSGNVEGSLTNVTTSPKWVKKPTVLELKGDFPAAQMSGVKARIAADFSGAAPHQQVDLQVASFAIPEKMFSKSEKLQFGFRQATGSSTLTAKLGEGKVDMKWSSTIKQPDWVVETENKIVKEILSGVVQSIPVININGTAQGPWTNMSLHMNSNLGEEISNGLKQQVGKKIAEAEGKIQSLIDEKIKGPQQKLNSQLSANNNMLDKIKNLDKVYKDNEKKIKDEIAKAQSGGGDGKKDSLEEQGKKLLKGFKF